MAACFVSCYWLSLPPSVVFYRKKKDFYFSPFSESARRTDWDWESLYKNHGFTHLRKCFMWKAHTIFLKCNQKYQKRVFKHSNPQIFFFFYPLKIIITWKNSSGKFLLKMLLREHLFFIQNKYNDFEENATSRRQRDFSIISLICDCFPGRDRVPACISFIQQFKSIEYFAS